MSNKISKWIRTVEVWAEFIRVKFRYGADYTIKYIIKNVAYDYNIPSNELFSNTKDAIRYMLKKHGHDNVNDDEYLERDCLIFEINKEGKTAKEIKSKIKEITKDMEELIDYIHSTAEDIAKRKDIGDWVWEKAIMTERGFRPEQ